MESKDVAVKYDNKVEGKKCLFFFFKQRTAYEVCGRDWSSDVCSSDLGGREGGREGREGGRGGLTYNHASSAEHEANLEFRPAEVEITDGCG